MSCRSAPVWAVALLVLAGPSIRAQTPFPSDLIPKRTSLARLGLEREWTAIVPLFENERLRRISRSADLFFAQTDRGAVHTFEVHSGRHLWSASLGEATPFALPVSSNSYAVFGTCANILTALDRRTGKVMWRYDLTALPSCGTVCDEDRVMVGLLTGKVRAFNLRQTDDRGRTEILKVPVEVWGWQTGGAVKTQPLPAEHMVVLGSTDGRVYVCMKDERTSLYRFRSAGPIGAGFGAYGTRTLLIPSEDDNLYAIDLLTSDLLWTFPSGSPIEQAPLVAGEDIFVINQAGNLSVLDPKTGSPRWTTPTQGGRLLTLGGSKVYLRSVNYDLFVVDRATGRMLADPATTFQRAGLNLREYDLSLVNHYDDRIYFATRSGMIVSLKELGSTAPTLLRDPKALPFGYIPPEGLKKTPAPAAEPTEETKDEPAADAAKDQPAPEPEESKDAKPDEPK
jgi:outer membrane protein assembly factor BamB